MSYVYRATQCEDQNVPGSIGIIDLHSDNAASDGFDVHVSECNDCEMYNILPYKPKTYTIVHFGQDCSEVVIPTNVATIV